MTDVIVKDEFRRRQTSRWDNVIFWSVITKPYMDQGYIYSKKGLANQQQILSDVVDKLFEKWPLILEIIFYKR